MDKAILNGSPKRIIYDCVGIGPFTLPDPHSPTLKYPLSWSIDAVLYPTTQRECDVCPFRV